MQYEKLRAWLLSVRGYGWLNSTCFIYHGLQMPIACFNSQLNWNVFYFQKYTVSVNCNMGLKPTLVFLPHYYWDHIVQFCDFYVKHQLVSTCAHAQTHKQHCAWQILQENRFPHMRIANIVKNSTKCIHSRYSRGFIKWKLIITYFNSVDTQVIYFGFTQLTGHSMWCDSFWWLSLVQVVACFPRETY